MGENKRKLLGRLAEFKESKLVYEKESISFGSFFFYIKKKLEEFFHIRNKKQEDFIMTRGYVCIVEGTKILKVAYLESDAYLKYYGKNILVSITNGTIDEWMENQIHYNHEIYGNEEPDKNFSLDWIRKGKNNKDWRISDFVEYGYLYNIKTNILKVYYCGKLLYTIKNEEFEKYLYFFENDWAISTYLSYDKEKMNYDYTKVPSLIKKASMSDLELYEVLSHDVRMELDDTHSCLPGHDPSFEHYVYKKFFTTSRFLKSGEGICFICEKRYKKWDVLVQLPYVRVTLATSFSSEKKAVEFIRQEIRKVGIDKLLRFVKICDFLEIHMPFDLETEWEKEPWYTPSGYFTVKDIKRNYTYL